MPNYSISLVEKNEGKEKVIVPPYAVKARDAGAGAFAAFQTHKSKIINNLEKFHAVCVFEKPDETQHVTNHGAISFAEMLQEKEKEVEEKE